MHFLSLTELRLLWSNLPVRHRGGVLVLIPSLCLLLTLSAWIWSRQSLIAVRQRIEYSETIIWTSNNLLMTLVNAESGVQGYSTTRDRKFLEPYNQARTELNQVIGELRQVLQTSSDRYQHLQEMEQLAQQSMSTFEQTIEVIDNQPQTRIQSPQLISLIYQTEATMDQLQASVTNLQNAERQLLNRYLQNRETVLDFTTGAIWFTVVISLLSFWAAIYLFSNLDQELHNRDMVLQETKTLLQAIVTNVVDGVVTLDKHGKIEVFNHSAARMFGYEAEEVIGQPLNFLLAEPTPPEQACAESGMLLRNQKWQTEGLRKVGASFPVEVSIGDMQLDGRRIAIIRDITDFQQAEAKLKARADELVRLTAVLAQTNTILENRNRELEQFAYVTSHDLKAPLRAIANLSEWMEEDLKEQLPEENKLQMQLLRGRVLRMEALINGLLEYSRVGRTQTATETVSVAALLAEILDSLDPPDSFTIEIAPDMPTLLTKRVLLRQVFANLISNAIKHHDRPDGHIKISVQEQNNHYEFGVADDGPGIAPEYHDKIFAIFQTLHPRDVKESTGIGLSIVKKIVETEGGTIRLESQEGIGSAFYFTWPKHSPSHY